MNPSANAPRQLRQCGLDRFNRFEPLAKQVVDEMQDGFGVGFGLENRSLFLERCAQFVEILDDAVVNHGDAIGRMRMGVVLGRLAVGGPARVSDAGTAQERLGFQPRFEIS